MRVLAVLLLVVCPWLSVVRAGDEVAGASVELRSEMAVIEAGEPFRVGVGIRHRPGFHSYWRNPGTVGFATVIEWQLPDGFEVGAIEWPVPERVDMAGHPAHGYTRDVLLVATVTPPPTIAAGEVTIAARVLWMACADACRPGDERLSLTVPVGAAARVDPRWAGWFRQADEQQARPLEGWTVEVLDAAGEPQLRLRRASPRAAALENPYFFSSDGQIADGTPRRIERLEDGWLFGFERAEFGPSEVEGLPGLLEFGPADERRIRRLEPELAPAPGG